MEKRTENSERSIGKIVESGRHKCRFARKTHRTCRNAECELLANWLPFILLTFRVAFQLVRVLVPLEFDVVKFTLLWKPGRLFRLVVTLTKLFIRFRYLVFFHPITTRCHLTIDGPQDEGVSFWLCCRNAHTIYHQRVASADVWQLQYVDHGHYGHCGGNRWSGLVWLWLRQSWNEGSSHMLSQ